MKAGASSGTMHCWTIRDRGLRLLIPDDRGRAEFFTNGCGCICELLSLLKIIIVPERLQSESEAKRDFGAEGGI